MAGHLFRMDFDRLPRKMLSPWVCTKRPVGALKHIYGRGLFKSLKKAAINLNNWHELQSWPKYMGQTLVLV